MDISKLKKLLKDQVLVIVGFMGIGKSTLGSQLSSQLSLSFIDTDKEIEKLEKLSIRKIFSTYGEQYFREKEEEYILKLLANNKGNLLISLGGGSFINKSIRHSIKSKNTISLWLNVDVDVIFNRLKKYREKRPLTKEFNTLDKIQVLLNRRITFYKEADIELKVNNLSKNKVLKLAYEKLLVYLENRNEKD